MSKLSGHLSRIGGASLGASLGYLAMKYGLNTTDKGSAILGTIGSGVAGALAGELIHSGLTGEKAPLFTEDGSAAKYTIPSVLGGSLSLGSGAYAGHRTWKRARKPVQEFIWSKAPRIPKKLKPLVKMSPLRFMPTKGLGATSKLGRRGAGLLATALLSTIVAGTVTGVTGSVLRPKVVEE